MKVWQIIALILAGIFFLGTAVGRGMLLKLCEGLSHIHG